MTPQEIIRAQPFRFSAHVTDQDEAWIAAHMAKTVMHELSITRAARIEEAVKANPGPTKNRISDKARAMAQHAVVDRGREKRRNIIQVIGMGALSVQEIHDRIDAQYRTNTSSLASLLRYMREDGYLNSQNQRVGRVCTGYWSRTGKDVE